MKFLFISSDKFPPFRVDVSTLFGKEMVARGHEIEWGLQSEENCSRAYQAQWAGGMAHVGSTNNGMGRAARIEKHLRGFCNDIRVVSLIRKRSYDFVQVKDKFVIAVLALFICRLCCVPMVYWLSFPFPEASMHRVREGTARYPLLYRIRALALHTLLYRIILPGSSHVFVQSEKMRMDLAEKGIDLAKMTPVPMGIDLQTFPSQTRIEAARPDSGGPVLAYLGTLSAVRRLDFLVRVLARVRDRHPGARLMFVGDGDLPEERRLLLDEAARLGITDAMQITGFVPRDEALRLVAGAHVCLSPFYPTFVLQSTSPTKLVEYMALGRPVVANEHPEQSQLIGESNGGICVPWDEEAFAHAINFLVDNPEKASAMGERARRYVLANRTYERIAAEVEGEYCRMLARLDRMRPIASRRVAERGQ